MAAISGRPDGKLFKYIYADGLNGVIDWRLSAYDMSSPEEAQKIRRKVESGTYRGLRKLAYMDFIVPTTTTVSSSSSTAKIRASATNQPNYYGVSGISTDSGGNATGYMIVDGVSMPIREIQQTTASQGTTGETEYWIFPAKGYEQSFNGGQTVQIVGGLFTNTSVSGSYLQTTIYGDPQDLLNDSNLKNGWEGDYGGLSS